MEIIGNLLDRISGSTLFALRVFILLLRYLTGVYGVVYLY